MNWRLAVLLGVLALGVGGYLLLPPDELAPPPPEAAAPQVPGSPDAPMAAVDIPMAPITPGTIDVNLEGDPLDPAEGPVIDACRPIHERLAALGGEAFGGEVGDAVSAKLDADGIIAVCQRVAALDDAAMMKVFVEEFGVTPPPPK